MAKDAKGRKFNRIPGYTKSDWTKVKEHVRSNQDNCPNKPKKKK